MSDLENIFHITNLEYWNLAQAKGVYDLDALESEGFIHCSTESQVSEVANRIFKGHQDLMVLEIDQSLVKEKIVFENLEGGEELYPHIYGPLNTDAVVRTHSLRENAEGAFSFSK